MKREGRSRAHAITSRSDFHSIFTHGRVVRSPCLVAHVMEGAPGDSGRLAVVVSRKHGGAVKRNRIRRRIHEAIRLGGGPPEGVAWVLVPRDGVQALSFSELRNEVDQVMEEISKRVVRGS